MTPTLAGLVLALAWWTLGDWFAIVPLAMALSLAALHYGVRVGYRKAESEDIAKVKQSYGLTLALTQVGIYGVLFAWLADYFLSFPNRGVAPAALQIWAIVGMVFHLLYLYKVYRSGELPGRVWPIHLSAVVVGVTLGSFYLVAQSNAAQNLHQTRQQPLVDAISATPHP